MATQESAKSNIHDLVHSLFKPELKVTWMHPEVRQLTHQIDFYKDLLESPSGTAKEKKQFIADAKAGIATLEGRLKELKEEIPKAEVNFILRKLTWEEQSRCEEQVSQLRARIMEEVKKEKDTPEERLRVRMLLDPQGIFNADTAADQETQDAVEMRGQALDLVIDQILMLEGKSNEWAEDISEDDPDMELNDEELDKVAIDERLEQDQQAEQIVNQAERKREVLEEKKSLLRDLRRRDREKRKEYLRNRGFDALLDILVNYNIMSKAYQKSAQKFEDLELVYSVRNPDKPLFRKLSEIKVSDGYEAYFTSAEEVEYLREGYPEFYTWMRRCYENLQLIRTKEDAERVARSSLFLVDL